MFLGDEWQIVRRVYWSIYIRLRMLQFPKDGATVDAVRQGVVNVALVMKPSVIQEHILQTLLAFWFMCYTNRGALLHSRRGRAKANGVSGWSPAMQEGHVVKYAEEKAVPDQNNLPVHW
jgi:hypothetical protein